MVSVRADIELSLVLGDRRAIPLPATLAYDPADPYAVSTLFRTVEGDVTWVFARELLEDGLRTPTGIGDVAIWPTTVDDRAVVCLSLVSPTGSALLEADAGAVRRFLDDSYRQVPSGDESDHVDVDDALALILGD
jgi:hypothetical protein